MSERVVMGGEISKTDGTIQPVRFDPRQSEGRLIDCEHRARYWWASQVVEGKRVLDAGCGVGYGIEILAEAGAAAVSGVDIDPAAVQESLQRFGRNAEAVIEADLHELPFGGDSFDVLVCFETIEHLENAEQALAEFRRVLRPGGLLLVSSPNPAVYPAGNEHHVHEFRPSDLVAAVGEHFGHVARYRQHAGLASAIEPTEQDRGRTGGWDARRTSELCEGGETYGIIVAGEEALPELAPLVWLGESLELGWWSEQLANAERRAEAEVDEARSKLREAEAKTGEARTAAARSRRAETEARRAAVEARGQAQQQIERAREQLEATRRGAAGAVTAAEQKGRERLEEVEHDLRHALARASERERAALRRLRKTARGLLAANQELAQIPLLKHRLAELHEEHAHLWARFNEIEGSRSWRLTAPLRRLRWLLAPRR